MLTGSNRPNLILIKVKQITRGGKEIAERVNHLTGRREEGVPYLAVKSLVIVSARTSLEMVWFK